MKRIKELQQALSISDKALEARRKKFRMEGTEGEAALLRWLEATYEEYRDKVRLLGRQIDYSETFAGAMHIRGVEGEQEPESVPEAYQTLITLDAKTRRAHQQERSQELKQAQIRAATEALREKARRGEDLTPYLAHIQRSERAA